VPRRKAPDPAHRADDGEARTSVDHAGGLIAPEANRDSPQLQAKQLSWLAVDGRQRIGHALSRGKLGVEAFDVEDRSLGIFARLTDAVGACDRAFNGGAR
jgi:hypothetical protein